MNSDWTIAIPPSNFEMGKEDRSCCEDFPDFFKKYAESQRVVCSNETASSGFRKIDMLKTWMIWL